MPLNFDYSSGFSAGAAWGQRPTRQQQLRATQRALCTCPHCRLMWEHYETHDAWADLQAVRERLGRNVIVECSGCGQYSIADATQSRRIALTAAEVQAQASSYSVGRRR